MKIKKNVKHDSLSLKVVVDGKNWVRVSVGRGGWKITGAGDEVRDLFVQVKRLWENAMAEKMPYGAAIAHVESQLLAA